MKRKYNQLINVLTDRELLFHLYMTQIILLVISLILGFLLFDDFSFLNINWKDIRILSVGIPCGIAVVLMDLFLMNILPPSYYDDGGLNERIFRNRNILHIAAIAAFVGFSEELLFRGIIQTKVGLIFASVIFAIIHYRYLFNWFLFLNIILLSFIIGVIYFKTGNLSITVSMHFVIDFLLGLYIKFKKVNRVAEEEQEGVPYE
jgi:uncharacterized protein